MARIEKGGVTVGSAVSSSPAGSTTAVDPHEPPQQQVDH